MEIKRLHLKNFRNYCNETIDFSKNVSLVFGENAQGKTNIIEGLYLLSTGKSHRTNNMNELVRYGENFFDIMLEFEDNQYLQTIRIKFEKGKRRELFINEIKREKMSDLLGVVPSVLFAPESLSYVKGSPGERRRIMDIVLCQMNKKYLSDLQKYNRIIKNKNVLLKQYQAKRNKDDQLDIWNESQARTGARVIEKRKILIDTIEKRMNRLMLGISDGREKISLKYKSFYEEDKTVYESLAENINKNRDKEIDQGSCLIGPHRDDMEIYVNQKNSRIYCSQGQQRSVALALDIAIMEEIEESTGKTPILLLDDVMSELDEKRQQFLYELIHIRQTIITATEKIKGNRDQILSYIHVKEGRVTYG